MKKIVLVANSAWYLYNFRLSLLRELKGRGMELLLLTPQDPYAPKLKELGYHWRPIPLRRGSLNPWQVLREIWILRGCYREFQPDLVHHFTWKPVVFGSLAALSLGRARGVNSITGLGHLFLSRSPTSLVARKALPAILRLFERYGFTFVFQNINDLELARQNWGLSAGELIQGSGVNLERFSSIPKEKNQTSQTIGLFASRLLKEKGLTELIVAYKELRDEGVPLELWIAGGLDAENPSGYSEKEVRSWEKIPGLRWLGHLDPIDPIFSRVDFLVLPSWREGLSKILLEASAAGLPSVTTTVPGCKDVVVHEEMGLTVPPRDPKALARALKRMVYSADLRKRWGEAARKRVAADFSEKEVNGRTIALYQRVLNPPVFPPGSEH